MTALSSPIGTRGVQELEEATLSRYDTARGANHALEVRYHERCERFRSEPALARGGMEKKNPVEQRVYARHGTEREKKKEPLSI